MKVQSVKSKKNIGGISLVARVLLLTSLLYSSNSLNAEASFFNLNKSADKQQSEVTFGGGGAKAGTLPARNFGETQLREFVESFNVEAAGKTDAGYALMNHIAASPAEMYNMLQRYGKMDDLGSYNNAAEANRIIKDVLMYNAVKIINWMNNDVKPRLVVKKSYMSYNIGYGVTKTDPNPQPRRKAIVTLLRKDEAGSAGFSVISSFPVK